MNRGGTLHHRRTENETLRTARANRRAGFELSAGDIPPPADDFFLDEASPDYRSQSQEDWGTSPIEANPSFGRSSKGPKDSGGRSNDGTGSQRGGGVVQRYGQGVQGVKNRDTSRGAMASLRSFFSKAMKKLCFR